MGVAFKGSAKIRIGLYSSGATFKARALRYLENTSRFELNFTEEEKKLADSTTASGGVDASIKRIDNISAAMDPRHFTPENLALVFWGSTNVLNTTPIVDEAGFKIVPNMFLATDRLIDVSVAPVVEKGATVVSSSDYTYTAGGILINSTITTVGVASGDSVTISYTPKASQDVQTLLSAAPDVSLLVEGVNEVDGKYTVIKIWKGKLGVAQNVGFISEDFGTLSVTLTIQKDETVSSAGGTKSQYFMMETQT